MQQGMAYQSDLEAILTKERKACKIANTKKSTDSLEVKRLRAELALF